MKRLNFIYLIHLKSRNFGTFFTLCLSAFLILATNSAHGQQSAGSPVYQDIEYAKANYLSEAKELQFDKADDYTSKSSQIEADLSSHLRAYDNLAISDDNLADITKEKPHLLMISIPPTDILQILGTEEITLELVKFDVLSDDFTQTLMPSGEIQTSNELELGVSYRGIIKGIEHSLATVYIAKEEIAIILSSPYIPRIMIEKVKDSKDQYIAYKHDALIDEAEFVCNAIEAPKGNERPENEPLLKAVNGCFTVHLDIAKSIYNARGSQSTAYLQGIMTHVSTLYYNESIDLSIGGTTVWTNQEPFFQGNDVSSAGLDSYRNYRANNPVSSSFAHYMLGGGGGGVAYLNSYCVATNQNAVGLNGLQNLNPQPLPNYSWPVNLIAHELGHNFGSEHTHDCAWNGNNTPIDGCGSPYNGCGTSSYLPPEGGTIMSYCHLAPVGVNLSLGFGPQPGNRMRYYANFATCTNCDGGGGDDGGGGGGSSSCAVTFSNIGCQNAALYWNNNGSLVYYTAVPANGSYTIGTTYSGHIWVMKVGNTTVGNYTVNCNSPNYSFDAGGCNSSCAVTFYNTGCQDASLYLNNNGSLVNYGTVASNGSYYITPTYPGQIWVMKVGNTTVGNYTVNCNSPNYSFNAGGCSNICTGSAYRYRIKNVNSGQLLEVWGASTSWGANVVQWPNYGGNSQRWYFENAGNGAYRIVNGNSGQVLDVWGASTSWGANVVQWPNNGGNNQKWRLVDAGNGTYRIVNVNSGLLLDVQGASTSSGANVLQWGNNGGNNQKWRIELVSGNCNTGALVSGEEPGEEAAVALDRNQMSVAGEEVVTSAYPNPFTSQLSIRASKAMEKMQVFDLSGRLIYEKNGIGTMNLDLETAHWNAGVYLIKLQLDGADMQTLRVVK